MTTIKGDFPYTEILDDDDDLFLTAQAAMDATGLSQDHIWSMIEGETTFTYGPAGHRVNVVGYLATAQAHDGETYYEEVL